MENRINELVTKICEGKGVRTKKANLIEITTNEGARGATKNVEERKTQHEPIVTVEVEPKFLGPGRWEGRVGGCLNLKIRLKET